MCNRVAVRVSTLLRNSSVVLVLLTLTLTACGKAQKPDPADKLEASQIPTEFYVTTQPAALKYTAPGPGQSTLSSIYYELPPDRSIDLSIAGMRSFYRRNGWSETRRDVQFGYPVGISTGWSRSKVKGVPEVDEHKEQWANQHNQIMTIVLARSTGTDGPRSVAINEILIQGKDAERLLAHYRTQMGCFPWELGAATSSGPASSFSTE